MVSLSITGIRDWRIFWIRMWGLLLIFFSFDFNLIVRKSMELLNTLETVEFSCILGVCIHKVSIAIFSAVSEIDFGLGNTPSLSFIYGDVLFSGKLPKNCPFFSFWLVQIDLSYSTDGQSNSQFIVPQLQFSYLQFSYRRYQQKLNQMKIWW